VRVGLRSTASDAVTPAEWQRIEAQVAKLTAADGAAGDWFGDSVSISGDTALVGAHQADIGGNTNQGTAYVFYRDQGGVNAWGQVAKLIAADGTGYGFFGWSVAVSADTAVVGAPGVNVGGHYMQGAAYVFYLDQGGPDAWGQVAKLTAADGAPEDQFGYSVSVSGDTAVVGPDQATVGGNSMQGAAYVFRRDQGGAEAWGQVAKLTAADGAAGDLFGRSVSVSGVTAVAGASGADIGGTPDEGAAYVFYRDQGGPDAWRQVAKLTADDGAEVWMFGQSVTVSRDTAVAGAYGEAYVFYRNLGGADGWGQAAKVTAADGTENDVFGSSVSVSGDTAVVGARGATVGGNVSQGAAYVFYRNRGGVDVWGQVAKLTADDGAETDFFGRSVSVSGDTALVGANTADVSGNSNQGAAYVFALPLAVDDEYCTAEDTQLEVPAVLGVLANDMNRGGNPLTAVLDSGPSHGALDLHADGSFAYTSTIGFIGVDTFTYHANDGALDSNIATVRITVPCYCIWLPVAWRNY
jgi:hypothetical protein